MFLAEFLITTKLMNETLSEEWFSGRVPPELSITAACLRLPYTCQYAILPFKEDKKVFINCLEVAIHPNIQVLP